MIKTVALIVVTFVGALLIFAATRPGTFRVARTATIQAPPDKLHGFINDMRIFNTWNPYNLKDPNIRGEYHGPAAGPGAIYRFAGNKDVGKGSIEIVESAPANKVIMKLDMLEPFEGHNIVEFTLAPRGNATEVTWAIHGPSPFMARLVGIFMNMDRMIGRDFEAGLSNLKARAERA
jgi:polyketide cyclase/dehydrase/lipid transport protein